MKRSFPLNNLPPTTTTSTPRQDILETRWELRKTRRNLEDLFLSIILNSNGNRKKDSGKATESGTVQQGEAQAVYPKAKGLVSSKVYND
jgi:hypothetical protein